MGLRGLGAIFKNEDGDTIIQSSYRIHGNGDPLAAEAMTMKLEMIEDLWIQFQPLEGITI